MEDMRECLPHSMTARSDGGGITPEAYVQMQCDWYNATQGSLTGYDCPKCKNRGSVAVAKDGYQVMVECRVHVNPPEPAKRPAIRLTECVAEHDL